MAPPFFVAFLGIPSLIPTDYNRAMNAAHYALCASLLLIGQNRSFGDALTDALRAGDHAAFARALRDSTPNLNAVDDRGFTLLMHAARFGTVREMRELLDRGADPNFQSADKVTAFHVAVDDVRKVRLLVERGFDFKTFDAQQLSPLMIAAGHPRGFETVQYLVVQGADVRATNGIGISAVNRAAAIGEAGTISFLVEHGAPVDTIYRFADGTSSTPLLTALGGGHKTAALYLARHGAPLNVSDQFLGHSLAYALACGLPDVARELVERGADIRASNNIGEVPPILFAAYNERGDASMVKLLLEKGADINSHNDTDETALTWARKRGETDLVRFLEQLGAKDTAAPRRRLQIPANNVTLTRENRHALLEASAGKSLAILATSSEGFLGREGRPDQCVSCHQQTLPGIAFGWGAARRMAFDQAVVRKQVLAQTNVWRKAMAKAWAYDDPVPGTIENLSYGLINLAASSYAADDLTDAISFYLSNVQLADGGWNGGLGRPPFEDSRISSSALAMRALQLYPVPEPKRETRRRAGRARTFFLKQPVFSSEERAFQLLGLFWTGAKPRDLAAPAKAMLQAQRADGGWSQIPTLESDAYATGQILAALVLSRQLSVEDSVYVRGAEFLLRTQFPDGSWLVKSRTWPFQTHFATGFPHGKDQWISAAGTTWASIALTLGLDPAGPKTLQPKATLVAAR